MLINGLLVRPIAPTDHDGIIAVVDAAYQEHPGCVLDLPGVDSDLPRFTEHLSERGGAGWVAVDDGRIVACVAVAPTRHDGIAAAELKRLYVAATHRRQGLASGLLDLVQDHAVTQLAVRCLVAWSDTRFVDAHRLYERRGWVRQPETRDLHDPSNTTEYQFVRYLDAVS